MKEKSLSSYKMGSVPCKEIEQTNRNVLRLTICSNRRGNRLESPPLFHGRNSCAPINARDSQTVDFFTSPVFLLVITPRRTPSALLISETRGHQSTPLLRPTEFPFSSRSIRNCLANSSTRGSFFRNTMNKFLSRAAGHVSDSNRIAIASSDPLGDVWIEARASSWPTTANLSWS